MAGAELHELLRQAGLYIFVPLILVQALGNVFLAVGAFDTPLLLTPGITRGRDREPDARVLVLLLAHVLHGGVARARALDRASRRSCTRRRIQYRGVSLGQGARQQRRGRDRDLLASLAACVIARRGAAHGAVLADALPLDLGPASAFPTFLAWTAFVSRPTRWSGTGTRPTPWPWGAHLHRIPRADAADELGRELAALGRAALERSRVLRNRPHRADLESRDGARAWPCSSRCSRSASFGAARPGRGAHHAPAGAAQRRCACGAAARRIAAVPLVACIVLMFQVNHGIGGGVAQEGRTRTTGRRISRRGSTRRCPTSRASTST